MIELYDDQLEFISRIRDAYQQGYRSVLGVAPTGFGKSITSAWIARSAAERGKRVWFACHRRDLVRQTSREFWRMHVEHGLIQSGRAQSRLAVQVASIDTLRRRLHRYTAPDLLVIDEAHMASADTWSRIIRWAREQGALILGNSATPTRLDGKPLSDQFDTMVEGPSVRWLIHHDRLSDYEVYAPAQIVDTSSLHVRGGEYIREESEELMNKPAIIGDAIQHYRRFADGKRAVCYCVSIKHSRHVAEQFNNAGIAAAHIDGTTSDTERKRLIRGVADGDIHVLCNVDLVTTGFDLSAQVDREVPVEAAIMLRPTHSLALWLQMVGRALRRKTQPAIILDHVGGSMKHGLPDDDREWTLQGERGQAKRKTESEVQIRQCPSCYHVHRPAAYCPKCNHHYEGQPREIEQQDGELRQLDKDAIRRERKREQGRARTLEELIAVGHRRGQRKPYAWAVHVLAAREGRRPSGKEIGQAKEVYERMEVA